MRVVSVIEARHWINTVTGATASVYGAVPYTSDVDKPNWKIEVYGFTWKMSNGTIGLGCMPVKTREEALTIMENYNKRFE